MNSIIIFLQSNPKILLFLALILIVIAVKFIPRKKWRVKSSRNLIKNLHSKFYEKESYPQFMGYLKKIDPFLFEELILTVLENNKIKIKRNKRYTGDGGIDGKFYIDNQLYLIQAKRYKGHINLQHVKDFSVVCLKHKAKGVFIHTGKTGAGIKEHLHDKNFITVVSGTHLLDFLLSKRTIQEIIEK